MNLLRPLRWVALSEATSFLALLVATAVKYSADAPLGVTILGPIHGALFVAYVALALMVWKPAGWSTATGVGVLVGAVLPFGGFVVDRKVLREAEPRPAAA
jgi:integral membrane protein